MRQGILVVVVVVVVVMTSVGFAVVCVCTRVAFKPFLMVNTCIYITFVQFSF